MSARLTISAKLQVSAAIAQSVDFNCALCHMRLLYFEPRILEHMVPRAWTKDDGIANLRWVHKECADRKTFGNKATSAGGDLHKIAKVKRLRIARLAKDQVERKISKEKWRLRRKMDGSVVRVRTK